MLGISALAQLALVELPGEINVPVVPVAPQQPSRPGAGNLRAGYIRRRHHRLKCEWDALKAAEEAAKLLKQKKWQDHRDRLEAAHWIAERALRDAELCDAEDSAELAALTRALEGAASVQRASDIIGHAQRIERAAMAYAVHLKVLEEEEEESGVLLL